ncbi:MAG: ChaN family lipoprotein [Hyphomicrobiaceae bacterium]
MASSDQGTGGVAHLPGRWLDARSGCEIDHSDLLQRISAKKVVMLGETHDRFDVHRWQLHVAAGLHALRPNMVMGFEMFPRRVQPALDAWVAGKLAPQAFLEQAEWTAVWNFPPDLYWPLFHFCRQFKVPMLALNCRRALVSEVGKLGWAAIPEEERDGVTPARDATPAYRQYLLDILNRMRRREAGYATSPEFDRFVRAQQTWDRAFACRIAEVLKADRAPLVVGIIGRGHLEFGHGTPDQLSDLGVEDWAVLLPSDADRFDPASMTGIADAIFRLDTHDAAAL